VDAYDVRFTKNGTVRQTRVVMTLLRTLDGWDFGTKSGWIARTFKQTPRVASRVPGRRGRCLPKWYGRGIPLRYVGLPFEDEVYHDGRPIILFYVQYAVIAL